MCKKGEKEKHALINFTLDNSLPFCTGRNNCEEPLECEVFGIREWLLEQHGQQGIPNYSDIMSLLVSSSGSLNQ